MTLNALSKNCRTLGAAHGCGSEIAALDIDTPAAQAGHLPPPLTAHTEIPRSIQESTRHKLYGTYRHACKRVQWLITSVRPLKSSRKTSPRPLPLSLSASSRAPPSTQTAPRPPWERNSPTLLAIPPLKARAKEVTSPSRWSTNTLTLAHYHPHAGPPSPSRWSTMTLTLVYHDPHASPPSTLLPSFYIDMNKMLITSPHQIPL
ncbi:hypothetical protein KVT40_009258 [Elsinoe batatas]|uniref:Uncharacterized protein n=1 Tax=Elsinoe batatas TaxID=2601811 RepID=A0A8K0KVU9_9PEZI|nr:hypothetical protein KVT40_009258 [Elsinoe batatas]